MGAYLGEFEQLVMLAIVRLGDDASGAAIRAAVEDGSRRTVWIGAIYTTLQRLADKGLIDSSVAQPSAPGERKRKIFTLTQDGQESLSRAYDTWARMTRGLKPKLESRS
jgi:DNA-binding PadR family transcriptional regulator